jgi:hypothetical protein
MKTTSAVLAVLAIAGVSLGVPVARAQHGTPAGQKADQAAVPRTAEEHLARAIVYEEKAVASRREAAAHREMFKEFERQQGNPALQSKSGPELPWVAKMRKHCERYIADAERLAADADRFAAFHRMRAEELRSK